MGFRMLGVEALSASYDGTLDVLHDVDLRVDEHEVVTILGSNGAGKTTVANAVSGLVPHIRGRVSFEGEDITGLPPHAIVARGIAHVPAGREVFADQTVEENLLLGAHPYRRDRARVARSLAAVYDRFDLLAGRRRRDAGTLSGGEQQVLALARGLMARPRLLILDEPSMGLAPKLVARVFDLVREIHAEGTTILLVEKLAHLATELSDRLYVMELGRVVMEGEAGQLAGDKRIEEAYLGRAAWAEELSKD